MDSLPPRPRPSMEWGPKGYSVGRAKVFRRVITTVLGLCIPCRHRRQTVTGRKLAAGVHEMFLVCSRCGKRVSPGVLLGPGTARLAAHSSASAAELATASWLPE